jgi:hypothetical protein
MPAAPPPAAPADKGAHEPEEADDDKHASGALLAFKEAESGARGSWRVPREFAIVLPSRAELAFQNRPPGSRLYTIVIDMVHTHARSPGWC